MAEIDGGIAAARILVLDDSDHDRGFFRRLLENSNGAHEIVECAEGNSALERLGRERFDLFLVDLNLPGMNGIEVIRQANELLDETAVIILTGSESLGSAIQAVRLRVADFITKEPREMLRETLVKRAENAIEQIRLVRENRRLERDLRLRLTHLEEIHQQLPDALFATIGVDQSISEINPQARELLGVGNDTELEGRAIADVLAPLGSRIAELVADQLEAGERVYNVCVEESSAEGKARLFVVNLVKVQDEEQDGDARWVLSLRDVTPEGAYGGPSEDQESLPGLVGRDPAIIEMCRLIRRVAPMPTSVLITGPTGSGKEVVARAIHAQSERAKRRFVAVNCTALSSEILESELFGHVKGAFTGAVSARGGCFREADGGTLLLDEIGDTSESFQTKLLRVLETGEIQPVGQDRSVKVDVRIICATNKDLYQQIELGAFREDLYYRINVVRIEIPPLRDRPGDLQLLIERFRQEFNGRFKRSIRMISRDAMKSLARHSWPGNVRELRHVLEHAFVVAEGNTITRNDLPPSFGDAPPWRGSARVPSNSSQTTELDELVTQSPDEPNEAERIQAALSQTKGNIGQAAKLLDVHRTTLWRKMRQLGIESKVTHW